MLTTAVRPPRPTPMVLACYVSFAALGWFLNGFGSILPDLEDDIGERASAYPLLPGVALLVWGIVIVRRPPDTPRRADRAVTVIVGTAALAAAALVMGVTRWTIVSAVGALAAAIAAAYLIRLLPAVLATVRADDTERVMMRSNAYSSVAALMAPLAIGGTIAIGAGWLPGMALPLVLAAVVVAVTTVDRATRQATAPEPPEIAAAQASHEVPEHGPVPPLRVWWREFAVLACSIVVEFCFVYFAATYLHDERGLSTAAAAAGAAAWGVGMAVGRFVVSTWPPPRSIVPSVVLIAIGFVLLWAVPVAWVAIAGIGIAGIGAAPLYPSRATALLARFPGAAAEGSARASLASGCALLAAPALMAGLRAVSDVRTAYLAVPVLLVVLTALARDPLAA